MSFAVDKTYSDYIRIPQDITVQVAEIQSISWSKSGNVSISVSFWESIDDIAGPAKAQRSLDLVGQTDNLTVAQAQQAVIDNIDSIL